MQGKSLNGLRRVVVFRRNCWKNGPMSVEHGGPFIYDASAVLALLLGETGYDQIERMLSLAPGIICTVN
jgi:hypothetical protein